MCSTLPPFGAQITKSGCSIFGARSVSFGGGIVLEKTAVPMVITSEPGARIHFSAPSNSSIVSPNLRVPAPSETTAASSSVSAAVSSISSPPTEKPIPPIRPGSTSGRPFRNSIAARMSFSPPQPKRLLSPSLAPSPRRSKSRTP